MEIEIGPNMYKVLICATCVVGALCLILLLVARVVCEDLVNTWSKYKQQQGKPTPPAKPARRERPAWHWHYTKTTTTKKPEAPQSSD